MVVNGVQRRAKHLHFDGRYKSKLHSGRKLCTIRLLRREKYEPGQLVMIHCGGEYVGKARITAVSVKRVCELTQEDAEKDGFGSRDELIKALSRHYGGIRPSDGVAIIEFEFLERPEFPIRSADLPLEGNDPVEVARLALRHNVLDSDDDRKTIELLLEERSIRGAAMRLGGLSRRGVVRSVLRRAYERLKQLGLVEPRIATGNDK
ncbi:MAG: ASCH domain-containing protein [Candidatus Alkanophagales archaeon]